jgi:hypothetical protein
MANDLHVYDITAAGWTDLSVPMSGSPPSQRMFQGFTSAKGKLYVFGGTGIFTGNANGLLLTTLLKEC